MWLYFVYALAFVAHVPLSAALNLECKKSFGHFFGNAEQNDRGCCLSELGKKHCNQVNVNKENVKRQLLKMKMQSWTSLHNSTDTNCPHSETVYTAPIFGLSAWSSEFYAIDQRDDALQIVQQSFCIEECCDLNFDCKQVYDSVEMNVKDTTTMTVVRRKIFVAVRCDYGNGPFLTRARRSAEETTQSSNYELAHSETATLPTQSTHSTLNLSSSTSQTATTTLDSLESPEETTYTNLDLSSEKAFITTTRLSSEKSITSTTVNLDHQATTSTRASIDQTTSETLPSTNSKLSEPTAGLPQTTEHSTTSTTSHAPFKPLTSSPTTASNESIEPPSTGIPTTTSRASDTMTSTPTATSSASSEATTTTTATSSVSLETTTTTTATSSASSEKTITTTTTSSVSSETTPGTPIAFSSASYEPQTTSTITTSSASSEPQTTSTITTSSASSEPPTTSTETTTSNATIEPLGGGIPTTNGSASSETTTSTPTAASNSTSEPQTGTLTTVSNASFAPLTSSSSITNNGPFEHTKSVTAIPTTPSDDESPEPKTGIPNISNFEPLVVSTPTNAFTDRVKVGAALNTTESTVSDSTTTTEVSTGLTSLVSEKSTITTASSQYVSNTAVFRTSGSSVNGTTPTIIRSTETSQVLLQENKLKEPVENINSRTPHLMSTTLSFSTKESDLVSTSPKSLLDGISPKATTTHDGKTGNQKSSIKEHESSTITPSTIASGNHDSSRKLDLDIPIFHATSGSTSERSVNLSLSFTTSKFQNKNEGSSTAPSKSDQETEPSVAFSIEYEDFESGQSSNGSEDNVKGRAYQNEPPMSSGNYQPSQTLFKKPNIPPGYLQRPGVGIDDPVDHNLQAKETLDPEMAPQYKSKRNRGIITFYRDCVGIPLHNPEDHPCVFPFIYLGKIHNACTTMEDHLPWCATEVDPNNHLVTNNWGYCTAGCPIETRTCKTVVGGPIVNVFCRFPFRYKGVQYHTCTTVDDPVGPWCATQVDAHGDYMPDFWGRCECPESLNSTISAGRRELEESVEIPSQESEDDFPKTDGSQNDSYPDFDSQKSPHNLGYKNPFEPLPFETSTDSYGNTYIVTKQPQYLVDYWSRPKDKNPPFSYSSQRPSYQVTSRATTPRSIPQDYGSGIYPFTLPQAPTTSSQYYPPSYQRTTSSSPYISTAPGSQETSMNSAQWYGRSTTVKSYGYEMTTDKSTVVTTQSTTSAQRLQTSTPWYLAKFTTEAFAKSTKADDYGSWFAPPKTTLPTTTTTTTTTLSPIRLMSLRQRRPPTSKDLPPQGTLATYIPSFLNDTILEEFLLKYGLNLKAFEASTLM